MTASPQATFIEIELGKRIQARRKARRMSRAAVADILSISFQQLHKYERGLNRIGFSRLVAIAHALECRIGDLIEGIDETEPEPEPVEPFRCPHNTEEDILLSAYLALPGDMRTPLVQFLTAATVRWTNQQLADGTRAECPGGVTASRTAPPA